MHVHSPTTTNPTTTTNLQQTPKSPFELPPHPNPNPSPSLNEYFYRRPRSPSPPSRSQNQSQSRASSSTPSARDGVRARRSGSGSSLSINSVPEINVEPPVRPPSFFLSFCLRLGLGLTWVYVVTVPPRLEHLPRESQPQPRTTQQRQP